MFPFQKNKKRSANLLANGDDHADNVAIISQNGHHDMEMEDSHRSGNNSNSNSMHRRKVSDRYMMNPSINAVASGNLDDADDVDDEYEHGKKTRKCLCCTWKCVCLSSTLTITVSLIILFLTAYFVLAPKFAQSTLNYASMDIINGTISNPTSDSITLQTSIVVSNAGFLDGSLAASTVTVTNDGITIGTMQMPQLNTKANENTAVSVSSVLQISNATQFKISCKKLLQNTDQVWHLSGNDIVLTVDTGFFGKVAYSVNIDKDLILKGSNLYDFVASDFNVNAATNDTVTTLSNLNFISSSIFSFRLPDSLMAVYLHDTYIGYAPLAAFSIKPGLNVLSNQSLTIESYPGHNGSMNQNRVLLDDFFSNYIIGETQKVIMKGPISGVKNGKYYASTVLDGVLEETVIALGYDQGTLAFGGLVTSATQQGWKVSTTGKTVRGAYANFMNPLNVPIKIIDLSATATLTQPISYHVTLVKWAEEYDCGPTSEFAQLSIGAGIYKDDPSKTWVDVDANGKVTYFSIADPPKGSPAGSCLTYDFSCCFASLTTAYACYLNPGIQQHPSDGQLSMDYMPFILDANITMLLDNRFKVVTKYHQPFFPLYFGYQVYGGYLSDLGLNCKSFKFK
mmetsp:Transcript_48076/g.77014  ORF Transcript_48076/g.77014 Transcript_48076/m.77014 type:complete len:624 (-) Transcript_48076:44-1915(-)